MYNKFVYIATIFFFKFFCTSCGEKKEHIKTQIYHKKLLEKQHHHFYCPMKCICETSASSYFEKDNSNTLNFLNNITRIYPHYSISIYCHKGGFNDTNFSKILQQITFTQKVTTLEINPQSDNPNSFQWNDNLNRLTQLKRLTLRNCGIPALSRSIKMPFLQHLDLSYNKIDEIEIGSLIGLPMLETLDLSHNKIKTLSTGVFIYSKKLKKLSISHNKLTELSANMLRGPENLMELELDGNNHNNVDVNALNDLFSDVGNSLKRLEINGCNLKDSGLNELKLSRVPQLKRIGLGGNNLTRVPSESLRTLEHLETVDLSNNLIKNLEPCAFCACNISRVFLANNFLGLHLNMSQFKEFSKIDSIHLEAFADTNLIELDLSHNFFSYFDSRWLNNAQKTLKILHLSNNNLQKIHSNIIHTLPLLTDLHIANNQISTIPYKLSKEFAQLQFLNLSGNILENLPTNIGALMPKIETLDLSYNRLSSFSSYVMSSFIQKIRNIYFNDNPWNCECAAQNLQQYMVQKIHKKIKLKYERTLCDKPPMLKGQPLYYVQKINDCAIIFGERYGISQISELFLLMAAMLIAAFLVFVLAILLLHCGREHKQKSIYITHENLNNQNNYPLNSLKDLKNNVKITSINTSSTPCVTINLNKKLNNYNKLGYSNITNQTFKNNKDDQSAILTANEPYLPPLSPGTMFVTF